MGVRSPGYSKRYHIFEWRAITWSAPFANNARFGSLPGGVGVGVGVLDGAGIGVMVGVLVGVSASVGVLDGAEAGMFVGVFDCAASGVAVVGAIREPPVPGVLDEAIVNVDVGAKANALEVGERKKEMLRRNANGNRVAIKKFLVVLDIQFFLRGTRVIVTWLNTS